MTARLTCLVALIAALAAADASARTSTLSHEQLVAQAFRICASASNGIAKVRPAFSLADSARATATVVAQLDRMTDRLGALRPAPADARPFRRYVSLMRRELAALRRAQRAAVRGDRAGFSAAYLDAGAISLQARTLAGSLGLEVCSTV